MGKPFRHLGSAVMRGDQLSQLISPFMSDVADIRTVPFHAGLMAPWAITTMAQTVPSGSIVIFVKSAAKGLKQEHIQPLRNRGVRVGLDCIDTALCDIDFELFDFHIAASLDGKAALEEELRRLGKASIPVELLHHHHDPRLLNLTSDDNRKFRCGYVGEKKNALIPSSIMDDVEQLEVLFERDFSQALREIGKFTLHYGVRPMPDAVSKREYQYKPFTKGFTASACSANILVNREADDALSLLGEDYPYLVSSSEPDSIVRGFEFAQETFDGPVWRDALDRMRSLKDLVSPPALAKRMTEILAAVAD